MNKRPKRRVVGRTKSEIVLHSARTAVATLASLLAARLLRLPEAYWAPITTIVITQSSLGAAWSVSYQRFVGTTLGALVGALVASRFAPNAIVFSISIFVLGLLIAATSSDRSAYRFAGITLAIVLLIPHDGPAWKVALDRFAEVSVGVVVAVVFAVVWPEAADQA